jgi:hypothetical protein
LIQRTLRNGRHSFDVAAALLDWNRYCFRRHVRRRTIAALFAVVHTLL